MAENPNIEDLKAPLLAAVGAADLALATVNEILITLRERAEDARSEATTRVEERAPASPSCRRICPPGQRRSATSFPPMNCARPPKAMPRPQPRPTTTWSSVARPPWSGCAASRSSRKPRLVPKGTSTKPSS